MQLSVGSQWIDNKGCGFVVDTLTNNGQETWVAYHRLTDRTHYSCLSGAFLERFKPVENYQ